MKAMSLVLLAGLCGCGFVTSQFGGHSYSTDGQGVLSVDGVELPHKRWVALDLPAGGGALRLDSPTEDTALSGSSDGASHLEVQIFSEVENDGEARVEAGRVVVTSAAGRKAVMNGARGTLAAGVRLELFSGTGDMLLENLAELGDFQADSGTGDVRLVSCGAGDVRIDSGTGDVRIEGLAGGKLEVDSGTGDVSVAASRLGSLDIATGTGDVGFRDCTSGRTAVESGTGDVTLQGTNDLGSPRYDLGTGSVETR